MERKTKFSWKDKFAYLGYSDKQISELLKYPVHILQYIHERGYVNPDMNCGQIKQVILGITKNHLSVLVKDYAKNEYSTAHMRVLRLLLNIGMNSDYIAKYMDPKVLNYKQCFVLGMVLLSSKGIGVDAHIEFVKNAHNQVNALYDIYNRKVSSIQYDYLQADLVAKKLISNFDKNFYAAQIEYNLELVSGKGDKQ